VQALLHKLGVGLALLLALLMIAGDADAQSRRRQRDQHGKKGKEGEKKAGCPMNEATRKKFNAAITPYQAEKWDEARAALGQLQPDRLSACQRLQYEQLLASIANEQGKTDEARQHLENAIKYGEMPPQQAAETRFSIAQLYMGESRWKEAIENLDAWFATTPNPNSQAYYLRAICNYQMEKFDAALPDAEKAVEMSPTPAEGWLQLLLALRIQREEYKLAVPILEELVAIKPDKKAYYMQLSSVHGQLGNFKEALVPVQLAYSAGLLDQDSEYRRLAQLLLHLDIPVRCARVLEDGIKKDIVKPDAKVYELLGNCWISSRDYEKSLDPLNKGAAMAEDGKLYLRLGEVRIQREEWEEAITALKHALDKGGIQNPGQVKLLLGIAYNSLKKNGDAKVWFERAAEHQLTREQAQKWLAHLQES
jgi:tetratricopeptide (TPR) repeat protein